MKRVALAILLALMLSVSPALAAVDGAQGTFGTATSKAFPQATLLDALGGRTTSASLANMSTQTRAWHGFYGLLFGNITLTGGTNYSLFSWTADNTGVILMSTSSTVAFSNLTAQNTCAVDETLTGQGSDRVNNTFTPSANSELDIGHITIAANSTCATTTYVNSAPNTTYEEVILTDTANTVYATRSSANSTSFRGTPADYQIILPETTNSSSTTYYLYVEMQ